MPTTMYTAGFDVSELVIGSITLHTAGKTDITVDMTALASASSSKFFHAFDPVAFPNVDFKISSRTYASGVAILTDWSKITFGAALTAALQAAATVNSWVSPSGLTAVFGLDGYYDFSYSAAFTITFTLALGAKMLGFQAVGPTASATTHASDALPWFVIVPTVPGASDITVEYEPDNIASHVVPDDASEGFGITRQESPRYQDWVQQFETAELTEPEFAEVAFPYTFRDLFEHCRTIFPFLLVYGMPVRQLDSLPMPCEIRMFRSEGAKYAPERATPGSGSQFHIPFRCHATGFRLIGAPS